MRSARLSVVLLAGLSLLLAACGDAASPSRAATVDDRTITHDEVEEPVRDALNRAGALEGLDADGRADLVEPLQRQVLALLIQASVIEDLAVERGVEPSEDEVGARFQEDVDSTGGEEELADALANQQLSMSLYRDVLLPTQLRVDALRELLADDIEPTQAREARHILVESEEQAQTLLQELAGGADFGELAQEHSIDPGSAAEGGDLGPAPEGAYVPPFDDAVWRSGIGDIIGPVATDFGYHIIEVTGEVEITAADLGPQERQQQAGTLLNRLLEERFAAAEVEVADRYGEWDPLRGEIVPQQNGVGEGDGAGDDG